MYGETAHSGARGKWLSSLSPRVRGNHSTDSTATIQGGSIPACTGKPRICTASATFARVYPRVYGETIKDIPYIRSIMGLSPRVRGNRGYRDVPARLYGSIPACTGKPRYRSYGSTTRRVYPRVYGETKVSPPPGNVTVGLSPRVRGNHRVDGVRHG